MLRIAGLVLAVVLGGAALAQALEQPLALHIGGRVKTGDGLEHQWPGTYVEGRFEGPTVTVRLDDAVNILDILIDAKLRQTLSRPGKLVLTLADLGPGPHTIRIEKRTETQTETGKIEGVFIPAGAKPLPPPEYARQIEFIGDSYTAGYGNTSPKRDCSKDEIWAATNTQLAFGPRVAKHYGADYQINAISGRGVVRNYDGLPAATLVETYPFVLFNRADRAADPQWRPQIIVVALGTNDFSTPVRLGETWKTLDGLKAAYEATYAAFLKRLRGQNPEAVFLLVSYDGAVIAAEVAKVAALRRAEGDARVDVLPFSGLSLTGCDGHPDLGDDARIADRLIGYIDAHPGIWGGK